MNLPDGLPTLDPAYASDKASIWMCGQLYNGLVEFDENLHVQPAIAENWAIEDSGRTYVFALRDDVYFHDAPEFEGGKGRKMVASDLKYSFTRICNPAVAAKGFWIFNRRIAGLKAYRDGEMKEITGFEAVGEDTFKIHLTQPFPPFLGTMAMAYAAVVPREVTEKYGKDFRSHPVGTGPFRFKSWNEGSSLILLKNDNYFEVVDGARLPYLDAVQVRFIREKLSEFVEFCQGRLDFVNGVDKSTKDEIFLPDGKVKPDYTSKYAFNIAPQLNTEFIGILVDTMLPLVEGHPLADKRVRQALNHAIDRQKLVDYLLNGNGYPAHAGMMPSGIPGFDPEKVQGFRYDPDLSLKLLSDAGYPGGKGIPVLSLKSQPSYQAVMEFVQKSFERIGITITIDNMDGSSLREMAAKGEINLWRASWIADYPDGENYLGLFYSGNIPPNGANRMRFSHARFDSLFEAARLETHDSTRHSMYHAMENLMLDEAPVI
ncbi:MAG: ABC transporter substrate-binding protein, partial [Bacteroidota bacterium]